MKIVDKLAKDYEKKVISKCRYAEDTEIAFICVDFKAGYQAAIDQIKEMHHAEMATEIIDKLEREVEDEQ